MKTKILGLLAVGLLAGPMAANAIAVPDIDLVKRVNGFDANDAASAPTFDVGSPLTFEYIVVNSGAFTLDNVTVTDDKLGSLCSAYQLFSGDSFTCTVSGLFAVAGLQVNIGTVSGTYLGATATHSDPAYYFGVSAVPEPGTLALMLAGLAGLGLGRRRKTH